LRLPCVLHEHVAEDDHSGPERTRCSSPTIVGVGVGTDYLTTTAPSPLQHYWSLCIEEQFYLFWPAILIVTVLRGRRLHRRRAVLVAVLIALALTSCAIGVRLTDGNPPWGYFSLASRGWELAVGGLMSLAAPAVVRWPRGVAAAILVAGGHRPSTGGLIGPGPLLRTRVLRYAGSISYSWYLWHWPVLTLTRAVLGRPLPVPAALALCALSAVLAAFTLRLLENPVRRSARLRARPALAVLRSWSAAWPCRPWPRTGSRRCRDEAPPWPCRP